MADGRLGNQIFQFAFLTGFAKKNEIIFCINMKRFFDAFDCDSGNVINCCNRYVIYLMRQVVIPYLIRPLANLRVFGYVEQVKYEDGIPHASYEYKKGGVPLSFVNTDFFQSESFFNLDSFCNKVKIKAQYLTTASQFLSDIPLEYCRVFIHVRRGDYLNEKFMGERGIDLPNSYFFYAIKLIKSKVKNPFFIFLTDDPSYVERSFKEINSKIISKNSAAVDLAIMSLCDSGIISNSSFSWWGSALMKDKHVVVVPKYWYGWKQKIDSHPNIYPSWGVVIDVKGTQSAF
ncbi:alpha-1,2-fucosyltransferase [Methylomonas defluvii]|nr:alpha-1,2-fucosyltransferase [Methylomonas sp. OY6]